MSAMNLRDMPIVEAIGPMPDGSYSVALPGNVRVRAKSRAAVEVLVARNAPGSAVRVVPDPRPSRMAGYLEAIHGSIGHTDPAGSCRACVDMHEETVAAGLPD